MGWLVDNYKHSKYATRPLEDALKEAFSETEYLIGGRRSDPVIEAEVKVAVTATSDAASAVVFANYNRLCREKSKPSKSNKSLLICRKLMLLLNLVPYQFLRPERPTSEIKTWEACVECHRESTRPY